MKKKLAVLAMILCHVFFFAGVALANAAKIDDLIVKIEKSFFDNKGKWELVTTVEYDNLEYDEVSHKEKIYKAPGQVAWVYEVYDKKTKKLRFTGVGQYATKNFGNLLQGLKPGMTAQEMDRFFVKPEVVENNIRVYESADEALVSNVIVTFKNGKAHLLETSSFPDGGGGEDENALKKASNQFRQLVKSL